MELTFVTELGETYAVEIDENMELENVMALLDAEVSSTSRPHPSRRSRDLERMQLIVQSRSATVITVRNPCSGAEHLV